MAERPTPLFLCSAAFLTIWVVFGGYMPVNPMLFAALGLSGSLFAASALAFGGFAGWSSLSWSACGAVLFFCLLPLLQLVPLPPSVWHQLPGHALAARTLAEAGQADAWRPLTLSVEATARTALVSAWLATFLLALVSLSTAELRRMFGMLLILGLVNVGVGVVQILSGGGTRFASSNQNFSFLTGLFANKNHTGLFIAMTLLAGYAAIYGARGWNRRHLGLAASAALVLVAASLMTFSRAGILFVAAALAFLVLVAAGGRLRGAAWLSALALPIAGLLFFWVLASTPLLSQTLARFGGVGEDLRWSIWQWSWPLVSEYFPLGGGIGSFTELFPSHEQLAWVKPTFVNHAHNDYLEQLIEVGAAAPVAWALALVALAGPVRSAWQERHDPAGRLGLIGAAILFLVLIHSAFDYPLRRPGIAAATMVALAAIWRLGGRKSQLRPGDAYAK